MAEDIAVAIDSKQAIHCGVALAKYPMHYLEISNAWLFAAKNLVIRGNSDHSIHA